MRSCKRPLAAQVGHLWHVGVVSFTLLPAAFVVVTAQHSFVAAVVVIQQNVLLK